ncbi:hypothetical protein PINS_up004374 [Pythium insidiosum]|nr:hypothetical protein PINS_up004374 [Pythium insidiosum]
MSYNYWYSDSDSDSDSSYDASVQCSGITTKGRQCRMFGLPNRGSLFFCHHHFLCRGKTQDGRPCPRKATYGVYCCAAHDPRLNWVRPRVFRDGAAMPSRWALLSAHDFDAGATR